MAFVCVANSPGRLGAQITFANGRWDILAQVGFDPDNPDGPLTYYLGVQIYVNLDGDHEYGFPLYVVNNLTGEEDYTYESSIVCRIIGRDCRRYIAEMLRYYTASLVAKANLSSFIMETYETGLSDDDLVRYLAKYEPLCDTFKALGYTISQEPRNPGKVRWVMRR